MGYMCPVTDLSSTLFGVVTVFLGLVGLTMLEYGVSRRNYGGVLLVKNFLQFSLAVIVFWLIGYAFSFGDPDSQFIGEEYFGGDDWLQKRDELHGYCFGYNVLVGIFVIFIVNCALVEKVSYIAYVVYPICLLIWVWPVIVAWSWGSGWLEDAMDNELLDFGGSITVFTFAGAFGLVGAILSGRRRKRFKSPERYKIVNPEIYVLGAFLTILGVLGIGTTYQPGNGGIALANLWICGAISSVVALKFLTYYEKEVGEHYIAIYQGFIAGMVFIASSAGNTRPWVSALHGLISGLVFFVGVKFVKYVKIDDPTNVTATFLIPGIFGGILPGFIDNDKGVYFAGWESGQTLGTCVVGTVVIFLWAVFWAIVVFGALKLLHLLRLHQRDGLEGAVITQKGFTTGTTEPVQAPKEDNEGN